MNPVYSTDYYTLVRCIFENVGFLMLKVLIVGIVAGGVLSVAGFSFFWPHDDLAQWFMSGLGLGLGIIVGLVIINWLIQQIDMLKTNASTRKRG